jgi:hypothetical protein
MIPARCLPYVKTITIPVMMSLRGVLVSVVMLTTLTPPAQAEDRPCGPAGLPPALRRLVPQGYRGADFRPACRKHDRCYGGGGAKRDCDRQFLRDLQSACESSSRPRACRRRARRMYVAVHLMGRRAYRASQ